MEEKKKLIRVMFYRYCTVFTLIIGANLLWMFREGASQTIKLGDLGQIELMAIFCALGDLLFAFQKELTKRQELIRNILHYIYINVVVFFFAFTCVRGRLVNILLIAVTVAVIYWINFALNFYGDKKDALKMNDLLEKIYKNDE